MGTTSLFSVWIMYQNVLYILYSGWSWIKSIFEWLQTEWNTLEWMIQNETVTKKWCVERKKGVWLSPFRIQHDPELILYRITDIHIT